MSKSNLKGAFERARQRWRFAHVYICRRLGRAATSAFTAAGLLEEYTSRTLFHRDGHLVAFPALDLLAIRAGVNEKTMRRGIDKLEEVGLVRVQRRHNDSNLYFLTIPADAEAHLFECEAALIKRAKARKRVSQMSPVADTNGAPKCPEYRTDGNGGAPKCPTTSDFTSDLHSISKRCDEGSHLWKDKEEKGVSEEGREVKAERGNLDTAPDSFFSSLGSAIPDFPRRDMYGRARRLFGDQIAPIIAKAEDRGVPPDEIHHCIDEVINDGGNADHLAHMLLQGGEYW